MTESSSRPWSARYWTNRFETGGDSGAGSDGEIAEFKAEIVNGLVRSRQVSSVLELGVGDGKQLARAQYPAYLGIDVVPSVIARLLGEYAGDPAKRFYAVDACEPMVLDDSADLALSLDVIFHLVEDDVFETYMRRLFSAARRFVVVYSSNHNSNVPEQPPHIRHRRFTEWVERHAPSWQLEQRIPNRFPFEPSTGEGSFSDFYLFTKAECSS